MGDKRGAYRFLLEGAGGKNHLENIDVGERIILKWIVRRWMVRHGQD
jgi:hypothetical protein